MNVVGMDQPCQGELDSPPMAHYDYHCPVCRSLVDVEQPIGSEPIKRCPEGHSWQRVFNAAAVKIDPAFKGTASISPQFEVMDATGDPTLAFGKGKPDPDVVTLENIRDFM